MNQSCSIFTGCSFTKGIGLLDTCDDKNLWVNRLYNSSNSLGKTKLLNLSVGGSSNIEIFTNSISALTNYNCQYLFVAWTSLLRYRFSLGVETYNVDQHWAAISQLTDVNINPGIVYSKKYLTNLKNKFLALHHDHAEIIKVLNYTTIINQLSQKLGVKVFFINNILPWDHNYFNWVFKNNRLPADTTAYTQELLNSTTRDDQEFFELYDRIHLEYQKTQGTTNCVWLNLDRGFKQEFFIDIGNDNLHPGIMSHLKFGDFLISSLKNYIE